MRLSFDEARGRRQEPEPNQDRARNDFFPYFAPNSPVYHSKTVFGRNVWGIFSGLSCRCDISGLIFVGYSLYNTLDII